MEELIKKPPSREVIMALRSSWKGYLKLSLVSIPVKAYSAVSGGDHEIHFHQLHEKCHSRIKYIKTCPKHGTVPLDEIVSGYEYSKGHYVVVDRAELERLRGDSEKSVSIEAIVPADAIDNVYLTERSSYLIPEGRVGQKPYTLVEQCLADQNVVAVARLTLNGKDDIVMLRPVNGLLLMTILNPSAQLLDSKTFDEDLSKTSVSAAEVKLTKSLFDAFRHEEVDLADYKDRYTERLVELIQGKVQGQEVVAPAPTDQPDVINLMDALKKSVEFAKSMPVTKHGPAPKKTGKSVQHRSSHKKSRTA